MLSVYQRRFSFVFAKASSPLNHSFIIITAKMCDSDSDVSKTTYGNSQASYGEMPNDDQLSTKGLPSEDNLISMANIVASTIDPQDAGYALKKAWPPL